MSKAYIVGAGPGDPRLLTIAAVEALKAADIILCDRLVGFDVAKFITPGAEIIFVGKKPGEQEHVQSRIYDLFEQFAGSDKTIARLKGGDPFVFGRGAEELERLTEFGYEVIVIPGISSSIAVPASAGIPLTLRHIASEFAVVAGHCCEDKVVDWSKYVTIDTLIILMGVKERAKIAQSLISFGRSAETPAVFIENGTTRNQRIIESSLAEIAKGAVEVSSPAVLVIGEVVRHRFDTSSFINSNSLDSLQLTFQSLTA